MKVLVVMMAALCCNGSEALRRVSRQQSPQSQMVAGMPTLISIGEVGRDSEGNAVVIFTTVGDRVKTVTPMPPSGRYPVSVFRYRVEGDWIHEIVYNTGEVRTIEVSR